MPAPVFDEGAMGGGHRMSDIYVQSSNLENIVVGTLTAKWSAAGDRILRYYIDFRHKKLNLHKELSAPELFILQSKVDALIASWDEKYAQYVQRCEVIAGKDAADELTATSIKMLDSLHRVLSHTLTVNDAVDWDALKDHSEYPMPDRFPETRPAFRPLPRPQYSEPKIGFIDLILGKKTKKLETAEMAHAEAVSAWEVEDAARQEKHRKEVAQWEQRQSQFWAEHHHHQEMLLAEQVAQNAKIDALKEALERGESEAVIEHASMVLEASDYDSLFEKSFVVQFQPDEKLLMVAYDLPEPGDLPIVKSVKFVKATGELKESHITEREKKANFEAVVYQICLRTIHELFEADEFKNMNGILFNGFVNFIDPRTGREARSCLISILVRKDEFEAIDLGRVEPKTCFKSLKGVSAASLASLTPIPPVMEMDREDRRFIESHDVGSSMRADTNIAAMPWEDFEHLVRELFEKEFLSRGGEVKVTRASSDGGVDAIAFDPDPISGGKIVIQAKRYTRTVGVSAVRDLFGTVMNEGASKGILVTTSDYGPDAYQFATGKPLSLLNGANLLHLLERHGYRARIDVKEARAMSGGEAVL